MISWVFLLLLVSLHWVHATEIIRIPLIRKSPDSTTKLDRREVGYSPLLDHVLPNSVTQDLAYLGAVSIGTPPQTFLVRKFSVQNFN